MSPPCGAVGGLWSVSVVFPEHTHLLVYKLKTGIISICAKTNSTRRLNIVLI